MAKKINLKGGKINLKQGVIFFGVPDEGDKFIITCIGPSTNIYTPQVNSLVLCLEDRYWEIDELELLEFNVINYETAEQVAIFLYNQFNTIAFKFYYNINRVGNIITITKKPTFPSRFIGECKLLINNKIMASSIEFTETIPYPSFGQPDRYVHFKLLIDGIELSRNYVSSGMMQNPISYTTIATNFQTEFNNHPTLKNTYVMIRDQATLIVYKKNVWEAAPSLVLEQPIQRSSVTYEFNGNTNILDDKTVVFEPIPGHSSSKISVTFTKPSPATTGWQYTILESAFMNHSYWKSIITITMGTVPQATLSFTLTYIEQDTGFFTQNGQVDSPAWNWVGTGHTIYLLPYNYIGYNINNNAIIAYNAPEFEFTQQLIRGQIKEGRISS